MKDKFLYEARIYSESQKNRFFQSWKHHTADVSKTTQRMKMMLGTMRRDKARNAFGKFQNAINVSRLHASDVLDQKLLADAKQKALMKMNRVIQHAKHAQLASMWRTWMDDLEQYRLDAIDEEFRKELEVAEATGYKRARDEFEPDILFLREALRRGRASAFAKYLDIFQGNNEKRGKIYIMGMWRSYTKDKAGRLEEERRLKELQTLKDAVKSAESEMQALKDEKSALARQVRELQEDGHSAQLEFSDKLKQMKIDLDAAVRNEEMIRSQSSLDKKHSDAMLVNKERQLEDQQQELAEREARHQRAMQRLEQKCAELEVENGKEAHSRKELIKKTRDLNFRTESDVSLLREDLQKAQTAERRALADKDVLLDGMKGTTSMLHTEKAENAMLVNKVNELTAKLQGMEREQDGLQKKLNRATEQLAVASTGKPAPKQ